jgi:4-diphosphocytidyl-2-C-methyl-D-erythritol kinase
VTTDTRAAATTARVAAQAKVNLLLHVLAREATGYHQLETLFCRLTLADAVTVRVTRGTRALECIGADVGPVEQNLGYRAAVAYIEARGWPAGFEIAIEKRIPVGGGLGGGSADAGAVLRALAALDPTPIAEPALLTLAGRLGADVPFLTSAAPTALAWGRGDRLLAVPAPAVRSVVLYRPPFAVNTAQAYGWLAETRGAAAAPARAIECGALTDWSWLAAHAVNDFEGPVGARHPVLLAALAALGGVSGIAIARMSGSGSVLFGVIDPTADAAAVAKAAESALGDAVLLTATAASVAPVECS